MFFYKCARSSSNATRKKVLLHAHAQVRTAVFCPLTSSAAKAEKPAAFLKDRPLRPRRSIPDQRSGSNQRPPGLKPVRQLGGIMTGLGSVTANFVPTVSFPSSSVDSSAVTNPSCQSLSISSGVPSSGLAARLARTFTTGIRGTAPPPLG